MALSRSAWPVSRMRIVAGKFSLTSRNSSMPFVLAILRSLTTTGKVWASIIFRASCALFRGVDLEFSMQHKLEAFQDGRVVIDKKDFVAVVHIYGIGPSRFRRKYIFRQGVRRGRQGLVAWNPNLHYGLAMKHLPALAVCFLLLLLAGCKTNPNCIIPLPESEEFVGQYLEKSDVLRIGHALSVVAPRTPVQWENPDSGYQFSMMVFSSDSAGGAAVSRFTVLAIEPDGKAEVLALLGRSTQPGVWNIVAEAPASSVGKASRMTLEPSPVPKASMSSDQFNGFVVEK